MSHDHLLHISWHVRRMLIEEIMALAGRASSDPARYRRYLESCELPTLQRTRADLVGATLDTRSLSLSETTHP